MYKKRKGKYCKYKTISFVLTAALLVSTGSAVKYQTKALAAASFPQVTALASIQAKTYEEKLKEAQERQKEYEQKKKETQAKIKELETKKNNILTYIQELDEQLTTLAQELSELEESITKTNDELDATRKELEAAKETEAKQYETMKLRIQYLYENGSEGIVETLADSGSITDFLNQVEYAKKISEYDNDLLQGYIDTKTMIAEKEQYLSAQLEELKVQEEEKTYTQDTLLALSSQKAAEIEEYTKQLAIDDELLSEYADQIVNAKEDISQIKAEEKKRLEEEERKRKEEEERRKREEERRKQESVTVATSDASSLNSMIWPLPGDGRIFSYFGPRKAPTAGASTYHQGLDIGGEMGASIVASLAGTVVSAGYSVSGGNYVEISHGNGVSTRYLHCSQLLVSSGQYVKQGQVIAKVGSTGISTGPHLHFTLKLNGIPVDPLKYVSY